MFTLHVRFISDRRRQLNSTHFTHFGPVMFQNDVTFQSVPSICLKRTFFTSGKKDKIDLQSNSMKQKNWGQNWPKLRPELTPQYDCIVRSYIVYFRDIPDRWEVGTSYTHHPTSNNHICPYFTLHFDMLLLHFQPTWALEHHIHKKEGGKGVISLLHILKPCSWEVKWNVVLNWKEV